MNTTVLRKGGETSHDHEFEDFEVQTLDFTILELHELHEEESLVMMVHLDRVSKDMNFEISGKQVAVFKCEDGKPYYRIRGPVKLTASENGFIVKTNGGPCHICGSQVGTIRCVSCGKVICTRLEDDANPEGLLPERDFPCKSLGEDPCLCANCEKDGIKAFEGPK